MSGGPATALEANGFNVLRARDAAEARRMVLELIPDGATVHHGASQTLEGEASVGANRRIARRSQIAVLGPEGGLRVSNAIPGTRFMLMAGKPYGEDPIYNGPYVD